MRGIILTYVKCNHINTRGNVLETPVSQGLK